MEGPIIDVVMLGLLVTFFGIQQRHRPEPYFRFWFAGWICTFLSFLAWQWHFASPVLAALRYTIRLNALYLGGLAFLLSFVAHTASRKRTVVLGFSVALPAAFLIQLAYLPHPSFHFIFPLILILQINFIHLTGALLPKDWKDRRIALGLISLLMGVTLVVLARTGNILDMEDWIMAQVFLSTAVLYSATGKRGSLSWVIGTLGFAVWGLSYAGFGILRHHPTVLHLVVQFWNLPKYAVGFAMTVRIFEGARNDIVQLADRYKDLYADFRLLYEHHPLPMWIYDASSRRFLTANAAATQSYGYTRDEFLGMNVEQLADAPETSPDTFQDRSCLGGSFEAGSGDSQPGADIADPAPRATSRDRHCRKDGTSLAVELTEHNILFQGREARFVLAVDVTEREKLNEQLFHRAQHDSLTGLPNRLLLDDRIEQSLLRATRDHKKAVLFTIDADRFKLINDTYGHLVGDETLKAIADRLRTRIRSVDTIARTGGEEFTAIIGGLNCPEDAEKIAANFIRLFDTPLALGQQDLKVSVSIGAAIFPDDATDTETLRKKSDQALYHAKRFGRNRFSFASTEVCASFDQAMAIELALRQALRNNAFELDFQPVYDANGCALHFEALLRMTVENPTIYPPSLFIPVAEESGLIIPIGNLVIQQACQHLLQWKRLGRLNPIIAINISGKQLLHKGFSNFILETLREHQLPTSSLQLELTETSLMTEPASMRDAMVELAAAGIRFSIDDFGAGFSSLSRLVDLPISQLKIDRSFIGQLDRTNRSDGIVTAIIHMAQTLHVEVVAEGVENESQLHLLLRRGCTLFQGFHLSYPVSAAHVDLAIETKCPSLTRHPAFSNTRVALAKRLSQVPSQTPSQTPSQPAQLPSLAGTGAA